MEDYETEGSSYVLLKPDDIDAVRLEPRKALELVQFVGACEISPIWFDKPYGIVRGGDLAHDAYPPCTSQR